MQPSPQKDNRNTQHINVEFGDWVKEFTVLMSTRPRLGVDKPMELPIKKQPSNKGLLHIEDVFPKTVKQ